VTASSYISTTTMKREKTLQGGCWLCLCCVINVALNSPIKVTDGIVHEFAVPSLQAMRGDLKKMAWYES